MQTRVSQIVVQTRFPKRARERWYSFLLVAEDSLGAKDFVASKNDWKKNRGFSMFGIDHLDSVLDLSLLMSRLRYS
ncbi:hypothetical protein C478_02622 [Natrinema thermotolerans DSM 11552]|nr:hypothetical protein C478_02622 [Natrinema thermotolerans DSM 11552]